MCVFAETFCRVLMIIMTVLYTMSLLRAVATPNSRYHTRCIYICFYNYLSKPTVKKSWQRQYCKGGMPLHLLTTKTTNIR